MNGTVPSVQADPAIRPPPTLLGHVLGRLLPAWVVLAGVPLALLGLTLLLRQQTAAFQQGAERVSAAEVLLADVLDMETGLRGYALTGEALFLEPYLRANRVLDLNLQALTLTSAGSADPAQQAEFERAAGASGQLIARWRQVYVQPVLRLGRAGSIARSARPLSATGKQLVDQLRTELGTVERLGREQAQVAQARLQQLGRVWLPLVSLLTVVVLLLNLWIPLRLANELRQGVRAVLNGEPSWLRWQETEEMRAGVNAVRGALEQEREQLRRTDLTLDAVLNAMTAQLWVLDGAGRVRRVNRAGLTALGLPQMPEGGQEVRDLWPELARLLAATPGELPPDPQELSTPAGPRWYLLTWERQEVGTLLLLTDVTPLQASRRALEDSNLSLTRSNTDLEHYAFVASHDLQEPLRTIASFAGLLLMTQGERLDERGLFYARNVIEGAERLKRLIQDLLSFAKVRAEVLDFVPVEMTRITEEVLVTLQDAVRRQEAGVEVGSLPPVLGRESLLTPLLYNLIQNAFKFHRDDQLPRVSVSATMEAERPFVRFTVEDNGIGIAPQYQEQVFVIFQRLHGRARYEGNGLGLAICRRIVELHGGQIWLESVEGEGSRFHFTLPAARLDSGPVQS